MAHREFLEELLDLDVEIHTVELVEIAEMVLEWPTDDPNNRFEPLG